MRDAGDGVRGEGPYGMGGGGCGVTAATEAAPLLTEMSTALAKDAIVDIVEMDASMVVLGDAAAGDARGTASVVVKAGVECEDGKGGGNGADEPAAPTIAATLISLCLFIADW